VAAAADGNTGTWNGPAPRGAPAGQRGAAGAPAAAAAAEPTSALLNSGARMPFLGYGTYAVKSADSVRRAPGPGSLEPGVPGSLKAQRQEPALPSCVLGG
jgi:hypothetical protein